MTTRRKDGGVSIAEWVAFLGLLPLLVLYWLACPSPKDSEER